MNKNRSVGSRAWVFWRAHQ